MKQCAFSLLELLVVITIVSLLSAIGVSVVGKMSEQGALAREVGAARNLTAAYLAHAADNGGELMPGYAASPGEVKDDTGGSVHYPASGRYPWRLAQYLRTSPKGTLIVNQQARLTEGKSHQFYTYVVSLLPSLGMNVTFVGGNETGALAPTALTRSTFGNYCVTQISQASSAARLIVFCSARYQKSGEGAYGFHMVEPPSTTRRRWAGTYSPDLPPQQTGYVHFRYQGKAVAAMLDGHVELLGFNELKDMRRWCNLAAEEDDPNFLLTAQR